MAQQWGVVIFRCIKLISTWLRQTSTSFLSFGKRGIPCRKIQGKLKHPLQHEGERKWKRSLAEAVFERYWTVGSACSLCIPLSPFR